MQPVRHLQELRYAVYVIIKCTRPAIMHALWARLVIGIDVQAPWSLRKGLRRE